MPSCHQMKLGQVYACDECGFEIKAIKECEECGEEEECTLSDCVFQYCSEEMVLKE